MSETMKQPETLRTLRRALAKQERAEADSRRALLAYVEDLEAAGTRNLYAHLAEVLGCKRQTARERVLRARGEWPT